MRIKGVALKTAGLYPDDPGFLGKPMWSKKKYVGMNRDALLTMAKWHPRRRKAVRKQNIMMDDGSQRRCA